MTTSGQGKYVVLCAILLACGGGGGGDSGHVCEGASMTPPELGQDYAVDFVDTWLGTMTVDGAPVSDVQLPITSPAVNVLSLGGMCHAGEPVPALVQSSTEFDTVCFVCPPTALSGCDSVVWTYETGTAMLSNGGLDLDLTIPVHMEGCGDTLDSTIEFQSWGTALRDASSSAPAPTVFEALSARAR